MNLRSTTFRLTTLPTLVLLLFSALPTFSLMAAENETAAHQKRVLFLETKKALERSDYKTFSKNIQQLQDYPLYPYLIYWQLRDKLKEQNSASIQAFLTTNEHLPIAPLLRSAWLRHLYMTKKWHDFLTFYQGGGTEMQCRFHAAQYHTGNKAAAFAGAKRLWLVGHSQPEICDELFKAWEKDNGIDHELRWQRIELAMDKGNSGLARYLAKKLDKKEREQVNLWRRVHNDPTLIERSKQLNKDDATTRRIVLHGLNRLARKDPEKAVKLWRKSRAKYTFNSQQSHQLEKLIALNLAYDGLADALFWFAQLPKEALDQEDRTWAVRVALRNKNWKAALAWIETMPVSQRQSSNWQYWRARIVEKLGQDQPAEHLYFTASQDRGYYGFLAADQINADYNLEHKPVEVTIEQLKALKASPAMVRARELYMLLLTHDARREWESATAKMDRDQRLVAGKLANEWKWYDTALFTLAKANYFSDLDIRFPLAHNDAVTREAETRKLDPAWVYAVARQESAMSPTARSPAGALGLMQLMPSTGKEVAKKLKSPIRNSAQLLEPDTNIRLGAYYLRQVLDRFDNNPVLATAAYNAGPHRVSKWFPQDEQVDADIWIENMPYNETRKYVRRVLAYTVFYDQRLDEKIIRLNERMPLVGKEKKSEEPL